MTSAIPLSSESDLPNGANPLVPPPSRTASGPSTWWDQLDQLLASAADRANPILVKETRQALKSRQFVVTFLVVLAACWIASFGVVASIGPQIKYSAYGPDLFVWYYGILNAALAVIVPFTAFRSLAAEQEDNTFDLLSITTLSSRQIITGKLCSAGLQMVIYLSAATPFIAFTFLLRGIELLTVAVLLGLSVLGSLILSVAGLLIGTVARARHTQALISLFLVVLLLGSFAGSIGAAVELVYEGQYYLRDNEFWIAVAVALTLYLTTFAIIHAAASAQIAFATENRSTPLRIRMVIQQACFLGWLVVPVTLYPDAVEARHAMAIFGILAASIYWFGMGALMTGEWPHLSRRVQRSLPQSDLGRAFLTWFNPGPGAGYMFAIANLSTVVLLGLTTVFLYAPSGSSFVPAERIAYASILAWLYVIGYLGIGRIMINVLRRFAFVPMAAAFLLHMILLLAGIGVPFVIDAISSGNQYSQGYSLKHMTNPFWTIVLVLDSGPGAIQAETSIFCLAVVACGALLLNLRSVGAEIRRQRTALPERIVQDEAERRPPPLPPPTNPWDAEKS